MIAVFAFLIIMGILLIMLRYWRISSHIIRIISALILLIIIIISMRFIFSDLYESTEIYISLKDISGNRINIKTACTDIIIKRNFTYHMYSITIPPYRGYTLYGDNIHHMSFSRELLIKIILLLPLALLIFIVFGEQNSVRNIIHNKRMGLLHRDKMYIDSSVASIMKSLREDIEKLKTSRNEFEKVNEQIDMLEKRVHDEETRKYLQSLKNEYNTAVKASRFNSEFAVQLAQCSNYLEESMLRLDFGDIAIAVNVFLNGLNNTLIDKIGRKMDIRTLVRMAHERQIINYDMMYNFNWMINLDHDYLEHKKDIFPDIARIRKTINDSAQNLLHADVNNDKMKKKEDR